LALVQILKNQKGTYGFQNVSYRHVDGQSFPALITASAGLGVPAVPTLTVVGGAGTGAYSYKVTALSGSGETTGSTSVTTAVGPNALTGGNFNRISWAAVAGATGYKVYGRSGTETFMATILVTAPGGVNKVGGGTINGVGTGDGFDDTGTVTPSGALPGANTAKTYSIRVPSLRQGGSGGTNWVKTGIGVGTNRAQTNVLVQGR
jgi:hypothetical protein